MSSFIVDAESPIVPVWVSLPNLPQHFFDNGLLFSIARLIGEPLKVDTTTVTLSRPSVARFYVEVNLLQDLPNKIWIGYGSRDGFWADCRA